MHGVHIGGRKIIPNEFRNNRLDRPDRISPPDVKSRREPSSTKDNPNLTLEGATNELFCYGLYLSLKLQREV
jgi:hypothetical protein